MGFASKYTMFGTRRNKTVWNQEERRKSEKERKIGGNIKISLNLINLYNIILFISLYYLYYIRVYMFKNI